MTHTVKVPLDVIYYVPPINAPYELLNGPNSSGPVSLVACHPHMELAWYLNKKSSSMDRYKEWIFQLMPTATRSTKDTLIKTIVKRIQKRRFGLSRNPTAVKLENDRLIINQGIEECCNEKVRGKHWIKVHMDDDLFSTWSSRDVTDLNSIVKATDRRHFYNPIFHLDYRKKRISRPESLRLDCLRRLLGTAGSGYSALDIGCNMGYMSHNLRRQGFKVTSIDFDASHLQIAKALNTTYSLDVDFVQSTFAEFKPVASYDLVVALTVLYHIFFRQKDIPLTHVLEKLDSLVNGVLYWESGGTPIEEKKILLGEGVFDKYHKIGDTSGTGLDRELGFFTKANNEFACMVIERFEHNKEQLSLFLS